MHVGKWHVDMWLQPDQQHVCTWISGTWIHGYSLTNSTCARG